MVQRPSIRVHGRDQKSLWIEERKGKVEMSIVLDIEVFWCHLLTLSRVGPGFVVADSPFAHRVPAIARRSFGFPTTSLQFAYISLKANITKVSMSKRTSC